MPADIGLNDLPEIHQFLDGFYLSRIGIRILIGQHIALHEKQRTDHIGAPPIPTLQDSVHQDCQTWFCPCIWTIHNRSGPFRQSSVSVQPCAGLICTRCAPHEVVTDAIHDARSICMREFGDAPEVNVFGAPNITFAYVPSHLHHMVSGRLSLPRLSAMLRLAKV